MDYKKIISVILAICIFFHPISLYADDIATPSAETQETIATDEASQQDLPPATEPADINTDAINTASDSAEEASESSEITNEVKNENTAEVVNDINSESSTGSNYTENNIISEIDTGDANASADVITMANNNVVGDDIHQDILNITHDNNSDIDLSVKPECSESSQAAQNDFKNTNTADNSSITQEYIQNVYKTIYNSNKAKIINNISLVAVTGNNDSKDIVNSISTGDANVTANVFNLVNTNLVGNCGYFGLINVYGNQTGDIILPYEKGYIGSEISPDNSSANSILNTGESSNFDSNAITTSSDNISNTNETSVNNNVESEANTGGNSAIGYSTIKTGNSSNTIRLADQTNTNIVGNRWALVLVNYYGTWDGEVENWNGNAQQGNHSVLLWVRLPEENIGSVSNNNQTLNSGDSANVQLSKTNNSDEVIENDNEAVVENNIRLVANTGDNAADGRLSDIQTGNASVTLNEATVANTNIIGNNWFFSIINIFGNFVGNVIFSRPDLQITKIADKSSALPGEDITYTISFTNKGNYKAQNVSISDILPSNVALISYSSGASFTGNRIQWSAGTVAPGQSGKIIIIARVLDTTSSITNSAQISTSTEEPNKNNNNSSVTTEIRKIGGTNVESTLTTEYITPTATPVISYTQGQIPSPARAINVNNLTNRNAVHSEWNNDTAAVLALTDHINRRDTSYCNTNPIVCTSALITPVIAVMYVTLKRRKFFQNLSKKFAAR